uniref:SSD domain-containing protein n=1 Tax=Myotis myotis TaxID=51298 RepID=A0A7J8AM30_MYOMY|nr:hypothetical protein mMyoMyo1_007926 [Myotis myotis]
MFLGISPFCPDCPICWHIVVCNIFFTILCISLVSVVTSFLLLSLFIWVLLFFLMSLIKDLSILFIFSKNQFLVSLIFCIVFSDSILFISALIFIISFLLLTLGFVVLFLVHVSVKLDNLRFFLFLEVGL